MTSDIHVQFRTYRQRLQIIFIDIGESICHSYHSALNLSLILF
jgi:hypothetical protein